MSRKDNTFPKYVQLQIHSDNPPADLYERGSRKCQKCGTRWPAYAIFIPTPCCHQNADSSDLAPSMTWSAAVKLLHNGRFERYYEKWNDDVTDEDILFDDSIEVPTFDFDEEQFREGMEEIDRITGDIKVNE